MVDGLFGGTATAATGAIIVIVRFQNQYPRATAPLVAGALSVNYRFNLGPADNAPDAAVGDRQKPPSLRRLASKPSFVMMPLPSVA